MVRDLPRVLRLLETQDRPQGSYPTAVCMATATSSRGEQCQRLPFWLVVINSSLSLQNDDENQFPNLRFSFFSKWNSCFPASPGLKLVK